MGWSVVLLSSCSVSAGGSFLSYNLRMIFVNDVFMKTTPSILLNQVQKYVEVPQIQKIQKFVDVPVTETVDKIIEVPKIEIVEEVVEKPIIRKVPRYVEVPQIQKIQKFVDIPVTKEIEQIIEIPIIETVEEVREVLVRKEVQVRDGLNTSPVLSRTVLLKLDRWLSPPRRFTTFRGYSYWWIDFPISSW